MTITHAKVSGIANPADPDLVGGEDWDAEHVIRGAQLIGLAKIMLMTGGVIMSQQSSVFTFSKVGTGKYRAVYNATEIPGDEFPAIVATISTPSGAPSFVRAAPGISGSDHVVDLFTIDASGAAVDLASGTLTAAIFGIET